MEGEAERVEIRPEEELAGEGRVVPDEDRDRPNPPQLVKKVRLRDGRVCSNPLCRRRTGLHAHHIEFRAHGGRTVLSNEKLVCSLCHGLLHQGLLRIEGDPLRGVTFHPVFRRGAKSSLGDLTEELRSLSSSPGVVVAAEARAGGEGPGEKSRIRDSRRVSRLGGEESRIRDSHDAEDLIAALRSLGYSAEEAQRRVECASGKLTGGCAGAEVADEEILAEALRA